MKKLLKILMLSLIISGADAQDIFNLVLQNEESKPFSFSDLKKNKASVIIYFDTECPLCKNYTLTINEISKKYEKNGISFYLVFPDKLTQPDDLKSFKKYYKLSATILKDLNHQSLKLLKPRVTPEAYVFDPKGSIIYRGAIDNWMYKTGKKRKLITEHYLDEVLQSVSENKKPAVKKNIAYGCVIEY